jgi:hypothetical protein
MRVSRRSMVAFAITLTAARRAAAQAVIHPYVPGTAATYFVDSSTGNDSNNGLSPATAWQTITKVNAGVYNGGDSILFNASQTFSGAISIGTANYGTLPAPSASAPVFFGSFGTGRATISSGTSAGFTALNVGAFAVSNLIFVGGSQTTTTVDGISITNSQAGNTKLEYVNLTNLDVSLYGANGIKVLGGAGTSGFDNVQIVSCAAHDCTGGVAPANGTCGIYVYSITGYGSGATAPNHTNVLVSGCKVYNNIGKAGASNWVGSGIVVSETTGATIQFCEAFNNGVNSNHSNGPVGIWTYDANNIIIQFSESYSNHTGSGTADGGGFDLDGGCVNCTIQYCYSHGNDGEGFNVFSYNDGTVLGSSGCTLRYCISENDGTVSSNQTPCGIAVGASTSATQTGVAVYNNTVYNNNTNGQCMNLGGSNISSVTGNVANNIFYLGSSADSLIGFSNAGNPSSLLLTGNDYFAVGSFSLVWNATTYTTFSSWQTATGQEKISGSNVGLTSNPLLNNPGGGGTVHGYAPPAPTAYDLQGGSPMRGTGINLMSQFSIAQGSQDYYGNAIPNGIGTGYNVGAYGGT